MIVRKIVLTGHRVVSPKCQLAMENLLRTNYSPDDLVISGGNLGKKNQPSGADRMWARAAYEVGIPYAIYVPLGYGPHYYTNPMMARRFNNMLALAAFVKYVPDTVPFHWSHNFKRNEAMVEDGTDFVVCSDIEPIFLLQEKNGGTAHCTKQIRKSNKVSSVGWISAQTGQYKGQYPLQ